MGKEATPAARRGAIVVDLKRCLACRSCELACAKAHAGFEDMVAAVLAGAHLVPRVRVIAAAGRAVPVQCRHCEDAPCVTVCPSGALHRDKNTRRVLTALDKCIKCKACVRVCPYGAVRWNKKAGRIFKCDLCEGVVVEGRPGPHCVPACPTGALRMKDGANESCVIALQRAYDERVRDESRLKAAGPCVTFKIDPEVCSCCGRCAKECPVECITGKRGKPPAKAKDEDRAKARVGEPFKIDQDACVKCGTCFDVCPAGAVKRTAAK